MNTPRGFDRDGKLCTCECHIPGVVQFDFMPCCGWPEKAGDVELSVNVEGPFVFPAVKPEP